LRISRTVPELRVALACAPRPLGFVPTMGALHAGHASLVERCGAENATVVASIFVNPLQFGAGEDLARYPRDLEKDAAILGPLGVDVLFAPYPEAVYPSGCATTVDPGPLGQVYEGAVRPGHFRGVCTVVCKLLHAVGPDRTYLGRKDAQQVAVLRRMVRDLDLPVDLVACPTVREADGLARSSRNAYLSAEERALACRLPRGLFRARDAHAAGEHDPGRLAGLARDPALAYDYCACVDPDTFDPPRPGGPALLVAAVRVGTTRLIDNVELAD